MVKDRVLYLSRTKTLACIAVIIIHAFYLAYGNAVTTAEKTCLISVRNSMMWAVPCFAMASGALLLDRNRKLDLKKLFGKYILRMGIALVVFSVFFSLFDGILLLHSSPSEILKDSLSDIFLGTGWEHMWYIYLMIAIYLMLPIYKIISANAEPKDLKYLLAVYCVGLSIIPFIETISGKKLPFYICVYTIYPLYLFLGYALHTGIIKLPKSASALMFLISTGIAVMLTAYCLSPEPDSETTVSKIKQLLNVYNFPLYIVTSIGAYGFMRRTRNKEFPVLDKIAAELDSCSFGIYLIHMAVLKFIYAVLKFNPFNNGGTIAVIGVCIVTLAVSYVITKLLKFVPYVKTII
ncbi:MAG: acyltransferase [Ruminococcus sp.]|nr:acyltransferase [Ruminococcus sp.]